MTTRQPNDDALRSAAVKWFEELDDRGVFITDDQFIVRRWNQWLAAQTGRRAQDVVGRPLFELFPDLVTRGLDASYREALSGEVRFLSQRFHQCLLPITRNFHGTGLTNMAQSARIEPLIEGDTVIGTLTLIDDVTERVLSERELRNQIAASEQARQIAEEASQLKDEFLATLSHEIRTPLNAIIGWTRILQTQAQISSRAHALEVIERNAMAQMRLVDDLLDMSRIISGKLRLNIDTVMLTEVAQSAIDVVAPGAAAKKIAIEAVLPRRLPTVSGDAERLQQVVWNLLSNAVKFTAPGGGIALEIVECDGEIRLSVRDSGQGVEPDFIPYVFDRFRQADASASRRHGGLGLGLALVRQIVELHGGTVGVESGGMNQGATFWFSLPAVPDREPREPQQPASREPVTLKGTRILIVDDERDARELLAAMLENFGATVLGVAGADEALGVLKKGSFVPDVLVSDVGLPGTDGFALIRKVRAFDSDKMRSLPAIAVTAYASAEDRVRALVAGYQSHLPKPVDANALAAAITHLVGPTRTKSRP